MKPPSWSEFDRKTGNLEKEIDKNMRSFKNNHPLLDRALKQSFSFLPAPFNTYAQKIYDTVGGSAEEKSFQVLNYINTVKSKGEGHYYSQSNTNWIEDYDNKLEELNARLQRSVKQWTVNQMEDQLGQYTKYLEQLELSQRNERAVTWFNKGVKFANLGQNENAIACYKKAIEIDPQFVEAWNNIGVILQSSGDYKTALVFYDKALTINPNFNLAQRNKIILYNLTHTPNQPMTEDEQNGIKWYTADGKPVYG